VGRPGVRILVGSRDLSHLRNVQTESEAFAAICPMGYYLWVKRPGHEFDHMPPSTAGVTNEWSCTSLSPIWHHGVDRETCSLFIDNSTFERIERKFIFK
jgi:hypothetical protein